MSQTVVSGSLVILLTFLASLFALFLVTVVRTPTPLLPRPAAEPGGEAGELSPPPAAPVRHRGWAEAGEPQEQRAPAPPPGAVSPRDEYAPRHIASPGPPWGPAPRPPGVG